MTVTADLHFSEPPTFGPRASALRAWTETMSDSHRGIESARHETGADDRQSRASWFAAVGAGLTSRLAGELA